MSHVVEDAAGRPSPDGGLRERREMLEAPEPPPAPQPAPALLPPPWPVPVHDPQEWELAARYAPILLLDEREPFEPEVVGYRVFRRGGPSPSFPREIQLAAGGAPETAGAAGGGEPAACAVEYAIWWDWDIEHLYELEHVWVYVDAGGRVVRVEASWHGGWHDLRLGAAGGVALEETHPLVYVKPGKHALAARPADFAPVRDMVNVQCGRLAGSGGVWVTPLFAGRLTCKTPVADRLVHTYLQRHQFTPAWRFERRFVIGREHLLPWEALEAAIPGRVAWWTVELARLIPPEQRRWLRVGHRGASGHVTENSASGFRLAARLGADMVELDVRITRDGVPVVIHDEMLDRVTTGRGRVADRTWEELRPLRLRNTRTGEPMDEGLMTFADALALCREEAIGAYVDIKDSAAIPAVVAAIREHFPPHAVIVGSNRAEDVRTLRQLAPELPAAWLVGLPPRDLAHLLAELEELGGTYLHLCWENAGPRPDQLLTRADVELVHRAGKGVVCWHEERPDVIAGLRQLGVDAVCSDLPELLV